jgi:hypothetical protein
MTRQQGWRHKWRTAVLAAALLAAAVLLTAGALFVRGWYLNSPLSIEKVWLEPASEVHIGTPVRCSVLIRSPWYRWPIAPAEPAGLPAGLQTITLPQPRLHRVGFGTWAWEAAVVLQAYETGEFDPGKLTVRFTGDRTGQATLLAVGMPQIMVQPRLQEPLAVELTAAGPLDVPLDRDHHSWTYWLALGIVVALVLLVLVSIMVRKENPAPLPQLSTADRACRMLDELAETGGMDAEKFFVRLTDILRWYIEKQFQLRAAEQATREFLTDPAVGRALNPVQREALRAFMQAADLVKFARAQASPEQMRAALATARRFIQETQPRREVPAGRGGE